MQPWVIDANDMDADDILQFKSNLLHPNPDIAHFLSPMNKSQSIIIAPKGFGKTLLLKAKRLSIEKHVSFAIPSNSLVDKPSGSPSSIPTSEYGDLRSNDNYWKTVWLISFSVSIIKLSGTNKSFQDKSCNYLVQNDKLASPCDIFDNILSCPVGKYHELVRDYNDFLLPSFRNLHEPVAVFVDNIDEYYEAALREIEANSVERTKNGVTRSFWHLAQTGIASAARELSHINNHIKIFVSIRKEVLQGVIGETSFGQQLRSKSIIIKYSDEDLSDIITKNIKASRSSDLIDKKTPTPVNQFLGSLERVTHPATGDEENIVDFWLRHTLGRPRDVVAIGRAIAAIRPANRDERRVREAVREEARIISKTYLAEMRPHFDGFDPDILLQVIPKSVMSANQLEKVREDYKVEFLKKYECAQDYTDHPFCALYKIGLLGYVGRDAESGDWTQIFQRPGELPIENIGALPKARTYLIHPSLDDAIAERQPRYFENLNTRNIIGNGRRWLKERRIDYILCGDVIAFSEVMRDGGKHRAFNNVVAEAFDDLRDSLDFAQWSGGDSFLFIDKDPAKLIHKVRQFQSDLFDSDLRIECRFGGDAGFVDLEKSSESSSDIAVLGLAVQRAARLEPHALPTTIFVTGEFVRRFQIQHKESEALCFRKLGPTEIENLRFESGKFDIRKKASDTPILIDIYCLTE